MNRILALLFAVIFFASCAPRPYQAANMRQVVNTHKTVAIIPPAVALQLRPYQMRRTTPEQLADREEKMGYNIQNNMYSWILRKQHRMNYSVQFQDITATNAKLAKAGITYADLHKMDPDEVAKILAVDAVLGMTVNAVKPMSDGAAFTLGMFFNIWGVTNHTSVTTNIHDGATGNLMWRTTINENGSAGSNPEQLINMVMKRTARRFPYRMPK
jgi:hypothetical protein